MDDCEGGEIDEEAHSDADDAEHWNEKPKEWILRAEEKIVLGEVYGGASIVAMPIKNAGGNGSRRRCVG